MITYCLIWLLLLLKSNISVWLCGMKYNDLYFILELFENPQIGTRQNRYLIKYRTGVLLRADLKGHGHPSPCCQFGWHGGALLGQPSKGHPYKILIF